MSWKEFFSNYGDRIAGALFFAFQGEFEYAGTVHLVRDRFPESQNVRIVLKNVSCRKHAETKEWTLFGKSTCTVLRKMTCFQEIKKGVFSLQLDDLHSAFVILREIEEELVKK
jgi:hypothetical protein